MILQRADKRCPVSGCSNVWDRFTSVYDKLYDERVQDFLRRQVSLKFDDFICLFISVFQTRSAAISCHNVLETEDTSGSSSSGYTVV